MDHDTFSKLLLQKEFSDVQLRFKTTAGDPETLLPAHSLVLRSASKVFQVMLGSVNFVEGRTQVIEIHVTGNMDDAIVFLRYLYTRELGYLLDLDVYISLLKTAHLYDVKDLVKLCDERIVGIVTPRTVCKTYEYVRNIASEELLEHCKQLLLNSAFLLFWKNLHLTLDEDTMAYLLASDKLNLLNEEQVLIALWWWGRARLVLEKQPNLSVELRVAKLLGLVRKPLIENVVDSSPWYGLWQTLMTGAEGETDIREREPDWIQKVIGFTEISRVNENLDSNGELNFDSGIVCLAKFSTRNNIFLLGFEIQVIIARQIFDSKIFDSKIFDIFLNGKSFDVDYYNRGIVKDFPDKNGSQYICQVLVVPKSPFLLRKSDLHLLTGIKSQSSHNSVKFKSYKMSPSASTLHLSYQDETSAVSKLYYLV